VRDRPSSASAVGCVGAARRPRDGAQGSRRPWLRRIGRAAPASSARERAADSRKATACDHAARTVDRGCEVVRPSGPPAAKALVGPCDTVLGTHGPRAGRQPGGGDPPARRASPASLPFVTWWDVRARCLGRCGRRDQVNAANPRHVPGRSPRPGGRVKRPRWKHTSMYYAPLDDGRGWRLSFWGQKGSCGNG
jgi:hypothetical protein